MSKVAYIFPGQGSQYVGMGKDLFERNAVARNLFEHADGVLGYSLSKVCFEDPEGGLQRTSNTQPAIFLHSTILTKLLEHNDVAMAAGHSLGEYSALVFGGAMTFDDGLKLVRLRGELMQQAGEERKGTMAAIVGLDAGVLLEICREASSEGIVQCANFNSPGQIVISGSVGGVQKAMQLAKARGAKLVKELLVSGAFHSPLMESARVRLKTVLAETDIHDSRIPIYANVSGAGIQKAEDIRRFLEEQLTSAVQWEESIRNMIADGAATFVEIGPGRVLQGLVKRINDRVEVRGIDKLEDVGKFVAA